MCCPVQNDGFPVHRDVDSTELPIAKFRRAIPLRARPDGLDVPCTGVASDVLSCGDSHAEPELATVSASALPTLGTNCQSSIKNELANVDKVSERRVELQELVTLCNECWDNLWSALSMDRPDLLICR